MKLLVSALILASAISQSAFAVSYDCVAQELKTIDSVKYANVTQSDIDSMLQIVELSGHLDAVNAYKTCEAKESSAN